MTFWSFNSFITVPLRTAQFVNRRLKAILFVVAHINRCFVTLRRLGFHNKIRERDLELFACPIFRIDFNWLTVNE